MVMYHKCTKVNEFSYDGRLPLQDKQDYLKTYSLQKMGLCKEYSLGDIIIRHINHRLIYEMQNDISISYQDGYMIQDVTKTRIIPFSFYEVDYEEEYVLYQSTIDDIIHSLKDYKDYITYEFEKR